MKRIDCWAVATALFGIACSASGDSPDQAPEQPPVVFAAPSIPSNATIRYETREDLEYCPGELTRFALDTGTGDMEATVRGNAGLAWETVEATLGRADIDNVVAAVGAIPALACPTGSSDCDYCLYEQLWVNDVEVLHSECCDEVGNSAAWHAAFDTAINTMLGSVPRR